MTDSSFSFDTSAIAHHPDTAYREVDADIFLVHADGITLYNLNPTAAALWRLMAQPMSGAEMAEIMQAAFPDTPAGQIKADIRRIVSELLGLGFAVTQ